MSVEEENQKDEVESSMQCLITQPCVKEKHCVNCAIIMD